MVESPHFHSFLHGLKTGTSIDRRTNETLHPDFCKTKIDKRNKPVSVHDMNATSNNAYWIKAKNIGPIIKLDCSLTKNPQNIIFATNGIGKSFLSRAFRSEKTSQIMSTEALHDSLNSQEATDNLGFFEFGKGEDSILEIQLKADKDVNIKRDENTKFHVFTSDFVDQELRTRGYNDIDGDIDHEIIVGIENAELDELDAVLQTTRENKDLLWEDIQSLFTSQKTELQSHFSIRNNLGAFKQLSPSQIFSPPLKEVNEESLDSLKTKFDVLSQAPDDLSPPSPIDEIIVPYDLSKINEVLETAFVNQEAFDSIRADFSQNSDFFQIGVDYTDEKFCYLCKQSLSNEAQELFALYGAYLNDKTVTTQRFLKAQKEKLRELSTQISKIIATHNERNAEYLTTSNFFPSTKNSSLKSPEEVANSAIEKVNLFIGLLQKKSEDLTQKVSPLNQSEISTLFENINEIIRVNNLKIADLKKTIDNKSKERLKLQNNACKALLHKITEFKAADIENYIALEKKESDLNEEVSKLTLTSGNTVAAKLKVADTFSKLIYYMFGEKYTFNAEEFTIRLGESEIGRGGNATFSDGEKSVIAFCYFIAQMHLLVETVSDYEKIFLIIDDPMTSLSNNYIFSVTSLLKGIRIHDGEIHVSSTIGRRPRKLILTHNDYFFNVIAGNNVVKNGSHFELSSEGPQHHLRKQSDFLSPHSSHLKTVYLVANGTNPPDFQTPNSIRSVIEGIWRFCQNDQDSLTAFLTFAAEKHGIEIKSSLINQLSHTVNYLDISFVESDIVNACVDAINIVDVFAAGQTIALNKQYSN